MGNKFAENMRVRETPAGWVVEFLLPGADEWLETMGGLQEDCAQFVLWSWKQGYTILPCPECGRFVPCGCGEGRSL